MEVSDDAQRAAHAVNIHLSVTGTDAIGKWVALRLSDGGSDMNLYDRKEDAVGHQLDEFLCAYVCIPPNGMSVQDAEDYLRITRKMYDAGVRLADPDKHVVVR